MKQNEKLSGVELMDILASQLRTLHATKVDDRNFMKVVAQSKEVGNLAGKAIQLASYDLERSRINKSTGSNLLESDESVSQTLKKIDEGKKKPYDFGK